MDTAQQEAFRFGISCAEKELRQQAVGQHRFGISVARAWHLHHVVTNQIRSFEDRVVGGNLIDFALMGVTAACNALGDLITISPHAVYYNNSEINRWMTIHEYLEPTLVFAYASRLQDNQRGARFNQGLSFATDYLSKSHANKLINGHIATTFCARALAQLRKGVTVYSRDELEEKADGVIAAFRYLTSTLDPAWCSEITLEFSQGWAMQLQWWTIPEL